jgi:predicted RNase H-like HicB family nuclease
MKKKSKRYVIIIEKGKNSFGAYVPDLHGCVAVAKTKTEVVKLIQEAIELHLESLREEGLTMPEPLSTSQYMHVPVE